MTLKSIPEQVSTIDGSPISSGPMTHELQGLRTRIGKFYDQVQLDCTTLGQYPIILGIPWLRKVNPEISWQRGSIRLPGAGHLRSLNQPKSLVTRSERVPLVKIVAASQFKRYLMEGEVFGLRLSPKTLAATGPRELGEALEHVPQEYHDLADLFDKRKADQLPQHTKYDHEIPLEEGKEPPFGPLYGMTQTELQSLKDYLDDNLAKGFIRPSSSPAGAPVLFVKKKDGSLRLCVDYRGLNAITVKNRAPLPLIKETFDVVGGAQIFSCIDLLGAYNLLRMAKGEEWKTAFRTRYGHFEYCVMPFGLCNAPGTFQNMISDILRPYLDTSVVCYLDDICIFSKSREEHIIHVRQVLQTLLQNNLYVKASKCTWHADQVGFLGFILSKDGIGMDPAKIEAVVGWPEPANVHDLQVFLGFANFYRNQIGYYSKGAKQLTSLLKKDKEWTWGESESDAFRKLKECFVRAPIRTHFDPNKESVVETDASGGAIGGILSQYDEQGTLHPCAYFSRSLQAAELNYKIYDKELLAIVECLKEWRIYLQNSATKTKILSDHKNLEYFTTTKTLNQRQVRWSQVLSEYNFQIVYKPGKSNVKADALSRHSDLQPRREDMLRQREQILLKPHQIDLKQDQNQDHDTGSDSDQGNPEAKQIALSRQLTIPGPEPHQEVLDNPEAGSDPALDSMPELTTAPEFNCPKQVAATTLSSNTILRDIQAAYQSDPTTTELISKALRIPKESDASEYDYQNKVLTFHGRLVVPDNPELKVRLLETYHDNPIAGHQGQTRTLDLLSRKYYWPGMRDFCKRYVSQCEDCNRNKAPRHKPLGLLQPLPIPDTPWTSISMDYIVKLPISNGYDSILVIVDRLTKMAHFIPCKEAMPTEDFARLFVNNLFKLHGFPKDVISDRGSHFKAAFWKEVTKACGIKSKLSTSFHPETDGQTERTNQTLEQYLRMYCNYEQDNWCDLLPLAEFACNNAPNASTGTSPFFANYGYHPRSDIEIDQNPINEAGASLVERIHATQHFLKEEIQQAQKSYTEQANRHRRPHDLKVGQEVWLNRKHIETTRPSRKLDHTRFGPFKITEDINGKAYRLRLPPSFKIHDVFHPSLLEPCKPKNIPGQPQRNPPPVIVKDHEEYEVQSILDSRTHRGQSQYKIRWQGYNADHDTWEPAEAITEDVPTLVRSFLNRQNPRYPK